MREFFDTSTLLAAMVEDEPGHEEALSALAGARDGFAATHSLAECFATLTGGRMPVQLAPATALQLVEANLARRLQLVSLTGGEYSSALKASVAVGARGGAIYDVLLLAAARKCRAERIHTRNLRHFAAFAPDLREILHQA